MNTKETIEQVNDLIDKASKVSDKLKALKPEFKEGKRMSKFLNLSNRQLFLILMNHLPYILMFGFLFLIIIALFIIN